MNVRIEPLGCHPTLSDQHPEIWLVYILGRYRYGRPIDWQKFGVSGLTEVFGGFQIYSMF